MDWAETVHAGEIGAVVVIIAAVACELPVGWVRDAQVVADQSRQKQSM